jgi:hypothetical protein
VIAARLFWAALYICFLLPSKYSLIGLSWDICKRLTDYSAHYHKLTFCIFEVRSIRSCQFGAHIWEDLTTSAIYLFLLFPDLIVNCWNVLRFIVFSPIFKCSNIYAVFFNEPQTTTTQNRQSASQCPSICSVQYK